MGRLPLIVALGLLIASPAQATQFWISPHGNALGSTPPANLAAIPTLHAFMTQPKASFYIWAKPDTDKTLENWSLRLRSMTTSVLNFSSSDVYNPVLVDAAKDHVRWEVAIDPNSNSDLSADIMGFTLTNDLVIGDGIGPGTASVDPYYFNGSWLLGRMDYTPTAIGTSKIFLQIGLLGLNNVGEDSEDTTVVFGHDLAFANADNDKRHLNGGLEDANIQVHATPDADFNNDGIVSGADFLIWQRFAGTTSSLNSKGNATYAAPDVNIDGVDLAAWEFQYGSSIPIGGSIQSVPEPAAWVLSCAAALVMLTRIAPRGVP